MSYTIASPQPPGLNRGETAVTLDTGELIAVLVSIVPQSNNAPSVVHAVARQIDADGAPKCMPDGSPIAVDFPHTPTADEANDPAVLKTVQKDCLMAVLGESVTGPLSDPIHANAIANCSIRNRIAAIAIAGPVDVGALL